MTRARNPALAMMAALTLLGLGTAQARDNEEGYDFDSLREKNISQLTCPQLDYLAQKYTDIGDSSHRLAMNGSTPAADAAAMTAMQAYQMSSRYRSEMLSRCY
jgi:hypothetical protein